MKFKDFIRLSFLWGFIVLPSQVLANDPVTINVAQPSLGSVAQNLTTATSFFSDIVSSIFHILGIALFMASIIQYREFRNNPTQTPLRKPLLFLLMGIVVGFFPSAVNFIWQYSVSYNI